MHLSPSTPWLPTTYGNILCTAHLYQLCTMNLLGNDLQGSSAQSITTTVEGFVFVFQLNVNRSKEAA